MQCQLTTKIFFCDIVRDFVGGCLFGSMCALLVAGFVLLEQKSILPAYILHDFVAASLHFNGEKFG